MKTIDVPWSRSARSDGEQLARPPAASAPPSARRGSAPGARKSALRISTRCCCADPMSSTGASGPPPGRNVATLARRVRAAGVVEQRAVPARAEHDVLGDGQHRDQHEVLVHHADPGAIASRGRRRRQRPAVDRDAALIRRCRGRRARSSASSCRPRSRRTGRGSRRAARSRVDGVVGHQVAEALGDTSKLEQRCVGHWVIGGREAGDGPPPGPGSLTLSGGVIFPDLIFGPPPSPWPSTPRARLS